MAQKRNTRGDGDYNGFQTVTITPAYKHKGVAPDVTDAPTLLATIQHVIACGGYVGLSQTSDGGALCIYWKYNGEAFRGYANSLEQLDTRLNELEVKLDELTGTSSKAFQL